MAKKITCFLRLPFTPSDLEKKYEELLNTEKEEDLLAIELNNMASFNDVMGTIQHRTASYFGNNSDEAKKVIAKSVTEARSALNLPGTDEEIALQIKNFQRQSKETTFAGKFFPGVFCDIENTLIIDGEINEEMLKILYDCSKTKPITLWTGATLEIENIRKKLIGHGLTWKLVSKDMFRGAEVETAYDDENFSTFFDRYKVKVREFHQV